MKQTIGKLLNPEYQKQLNVLGGTLILMPQGRHESLASAEKVVGIMKYSLKANNSWNTLLSGKLNYFQLDYFIQAAINSMNSRPLCIVDNHIISPCYIQNMLFQRAYEEDFLKR